MWVLALIYVHVVDISLASARKEAIYFLIAI
jgi:hypothetical protein